MADDACEDSNQRKKKKKVNVEKTMYIVFMEETKGDRVTYVIRSINVSDILSSSSDDLHLRQLAYTSGTDLPGFMGCGTFGSRIVFAGGMKPALCFGPFTWQKDVYFFETNSNVDNDNNDESSLRKMDVQLLHAKYNPVIAEIEGKLHALSNKGTTAGRPSFEVFDPQIGGRWSALPEPPFFRSDFYKFGSRLAYAITGTKMFVSQEPNAVHCFDVAHPERAWRCVPSMCEGGPFPFVNKALVLDLPYNNTNNKLVFGYDYWRRYLGVYVMFVDDNHESLVRIANLKLPMLPEEFNSWRSWYIVHLGGQTACLVSLEMHLLKHVRRASDSDRYAIGSHKTRGVVIPFQFDIDTTKIDKDTENCLSLQFMPTRTIEFYTTQSTYPRPRVEGCFVL